jgi:parallel beta-helix repeat protein
MLKTIHTKHLRVYTILCAFLLIVSFNAIPAQYTQPTQTYNHLLSTIYYVGGNGTGNYSTIQNAINNATTGDIIYIYNGTYTEHLIINKTLNLQGESATNTIIQANNTGTIITIQADNCTINNCTIQKGNQGIQITSSNNHIQNNHIQSHTTRGIIILDNTTNNTIHHNTLTKNTIQGIFLDNTNETTIHHNEFTNHTIIALGITTSNHINIHNNTFIKNKQAINLQNTNTITIKHNQIHKNIDTISLFYTETTVLQHNNLINNSKGLLIYTSNNNTIDYNNFTTNDLYAIKIHQNSQHNTISYNTIQQTNETGIILQPSKATTIHQNLISQCYNALTTENIQEPQTITQNTITGNHVGLKIITSHNLTIEQNHIHNNTYGIQSEQTHHININNNTIKNNQNKGIHLTHQSNNIIIHGNTITHNRDGLFISDNHHIQCTNNTIKTNINYGARIENTTNLLITQNTLRTNQDALYITHTNTGIISYNTITQNILTGITLWFSTNFNITTNSISTNKVGIKLISSTQNHIIKNLIQDHTTTGILSQAGSTNNIIYHNNFYSNTQHAYDTLVNTWNNAYPAGGNYWDDYTGSDNDNDGIGDLPYNIQGSISQDKYPLLDPYGPKNLSIEITTGLGLKISIKNTGTTPLYQTNIHIKITGGIFNRINKQKSIQLIEPLAINEQHDTQLYPIGFGPLTINITAQALNTNPKNTLSETRIILLFIQ